MVYLIACLSFLSEEADELILEIFTIFSSISWIKFFTLIIIDCLRFMSFYFSIQEIVFNCVIMGMAFTFADVFCARAFTNKNEIIMGVLTLAAG